MTGDFCVVTLRQAPRFCLIEIHHKPDRRLACRLCVQNTDPAGFDHTSDCLRASGVQARRPDVHDSPVIGDQTRAQRQKLQRQLRFARPRHPGDQNTRAVNRHRAGMQNKSIGCLRQRARRRHRSGRKADDKARAERIGGDICFSGADVFGPDDTTMRFDDLFGNRKAETGVVSEMLIRAL